MFRGRDFRLLRSVLRDTKRLSSHTPCRGLIAARFTGGTVRWVVSYEEGHVPLWWGKDRASNFLFSGARWRDGLLFSGKRYVAVVSGGLVPCKKLGGRPFSNARRKVHCFFHKSSKGDDAAFAMFVCPRP